MTIATRRRLTRLRNNAGPLMIVAGAVLGAIALLLLNGRA